MCPASPSSENNELKVNFTLIKLTPLSLQRCPLLFSFFETRGIVLSRTRVLLAHIDRLCTVSDGGLRRAEACRRSSRDLGATVRCTSSSSRKKSWG